MLPYYFLVFVPALFIVFSQKVSVKQLRGSRNNAIAFFFFLMMGLLMMRDISCGSDLVNYNIKFEDALNIKWRDALVYRSKQGYMLLQKLIGLFSHNFRTVIVFTTILSVAPILYFYKRESEMSFLTIVLFLNVAPFSMYFSGLCQVLAMGFAIPMWYAAKRKQLTRFLVLNLLAASFHPSAIVLIVLYPLYHSRFTRKSLIWIIPLLVLVFLFNDQLLILILNMMSYEKYAATKSSAYAVLLLLSMFVLYCYTIPKENALDPDTLAMRNILLIAVAIQLFASAHNIIMRINYYFLIFIPVLIPRIARRCTEKMLKIAKLSVMIMNVGFLFLFFYMAYTDADYLNVFPYVPMWK